MGDIEVALVLDPGGKQVLVGDEVDDIALDVVNGFRVILREGAEFRIAEVLAFRKAHQFIGEVFVEDESEDVVLVFVGLDFGAHLVGRFPDFGGELLFVHSGGVLKLAAWSLVVAAHDGFLT